MCGQNEQQLAQTQRYHPSRSNYSGPSSLESGKTSSLVTSGPSSIDSGNKSLSLSRNSGHSSLDSHGSASTVAQSQSTHLLNSPRSSPKHRLIKSSGVSTLSSSSKVTTSTSANGIKSTSFDETSSSEHGVMPNSNSSGSITLQVTNNTHGCSGLPNTKIFVQNSPIHTSITFENGKFMENSNVFVINNETTTNAKGEVIASRKSLMSNNSPLTSPLKQQNQQHYRRPLAEMKQQHSGGGSNSTFGKENCFSENDEAASETCDSLSMISETSPDSSLIPYVDDDVTDDGDSRRQNIVQSPENCHNKFTKNNIFETSSMNNRKFSLPLGSSSTTMATSTPTNKTMVYNNMLKNHYNQQTNAIISPVYQNNKMNLFSYDLQSQHQQNAFNAGSVGNLKTDNKQINSECDLKNSLLNSNPTINSDSLFNIFQKNIIAVGSEPNLIAMKQNDMKQKINNCVKDVTSPASMDEKTPTLDSKQLDANGLYNFPSLTDLSFNFTSLHAQKILKGGLSVNNSIDTLVELDINKSNTHKSNTNLSPSATICTDFGMV